MNTANQECVWKGQCGGKCPEHCSDYTPADESERNEDFYFLIIKENADEYQKMIDDYSSEEVDCQ